MAETPRDRAHKGHTLFLQRIGKVKAGDIAKAMEVSDAEVSNMKNKEMERCLLLLAHLGLKCVPSGFRCVDPATFEFMRVSASKLMNQAPQLLWDEEQTS